MYLTCSNSQRQSPVCISLDHPIQFNNGGYVRELLLGTDTPGHHSEHHPAYFVQVSYEFCL